MSPRAFKISRVPRGHRTALVVLGALVIVGGSLVAVGGDDSPAPVTYATVRQGDVIATVGAAGNVQSGNIREVGFGTSGTVTKVGVKTGQLVKAGQVLARLDATQAQEQVNAAVAALAAANEAYDQAGTAGTAPSSCAQGNGADPATAARFSLPTGKRTWPTGKHTWPADKHTWPTTASPVAKPTMTTTAQPTTEPTTEPTAKPTAKPTSAARPTTSPRPSGSAPSGPGKGGSGSCGATSGTSQTQQSGGQSASGGSGGQSAATARAQAGAQVVKAQVNLAQARRALTGVTLTAPIDGTVLTVAGTVGSQVSGPGSSGFVTIGDLDELQVRAMFSQTEVAKVKIGQAATITLATRQGTSYNGTVTHIDPAATTTGALVQYGVMIAFDAVPKGLLLGQAATVQVTVEESDGTLYLPAAAVGPGSDGSSTVQVRQGPRTASRTVWIGVRGDQYVEIRSGLVAGDQVVPAR
jgi:multidrug efflux pump subunit AcrA (membrane-fusion protein)